MTWHPESATLQMHLDGELPVEERWRIEAHLRECDECAAEYEALAELVSAVGGLPASIEPPTDLWQGIAARIEVETPVRAITEKPRARQGRGVLVGAWIAAAAAVLVLGIGIGRLMPGPDVRMAAVEVPPPAQNGPVLLASYEEPVFDQAIAELQAILDGMRDQLLPETVATLEENLAIIDRAIAESRAALEADPANTQLHRHLANTMQTKLALLRMVTSAVTVEI
jgi:anti-sigma factor ChrR (cupin superfamily)